MKAAFVGSRSFADPEQICSLMRVCVRKLYAKHGTTLRLVSGGAAGADAMAESLATTDTAHECIVFPAKWHLYGRAAGPIRNEKIVDASDMLVAFWDGSSRGAREGHRDARVLGERRHLAAAGRATVTGARGASGVAAGVR